MSRIEDKIAIENVWGTGITTDRIIFSIGSKVFSRMMGSKACGVYPMMERDMDVILNRYRFRTGKSGGPAELMYFDRIDINILVDYIEVVCFYSCKSNLSSNLIVLKFCNSLHHDGITYTMQSSDIDALGRIQGILLEIKCKEP